MLSFITDISLHVCYPVLKQHTSLLQFHFFLLELILLLFEEIHLVDIELLDLVEVFLQVNDVF